MIVEYRIKRCKVSHDFMATIVHYHFHTSKVTLALSALGSDFFKISSNGKYSKCSFHRKGPTIKL